MKNKIALANTIKKNIIGIHKTIKEIHSINRSDYIARHVRNDTIIVKKHNKINISDVK